MGNSIPESQALQEIFFSRDNALRWLTAVP
jgi:hypothetical protein